jgi:hypothetical protein
LPPLRFSAGRYTARHAEDERAYELARYAAPTLLQSLTKTIPLFFSYTIVVILWIELVHALFEVPPEVLNRVEIG